MPGWLPPDGPWACRGRGTSRPRPLFRPQPARYARFLRPGPRKGCAVVPRHFCALWKRRSSNDLGFTRRNGPRSSRPQPGDAPVFPRLGSEGGMLRHAPCFLRDSKTAIFQRFVILASGRSMSDPATTGKIRPLLALVAKKGVLIPYTFLRGYQRGHSGFVSKRCVCGFSTRRADFQKVVRIFEDPCGFVMGIFCRIGSKSATFSPKKDRPGRFRAVGNPHNLLKIRTPCLKSAEYCRNPQTLFKIHTASQESARPSENPHT